MDEKQDRAQAEPDTFRAVLTPYRSLGPTGFLILMGALGGISFVAGLVFYLAGAWPVMGFFGLDVALVYLAFKLNYRSGRLYETLDLTRDRLTWTRVHPSGRREAVPLQPLLGPGQPQANGPTGARTCASPPKAASWSSAGS